MKNTFVMTLKLNTGTMSKFVIY